MNRPLKGLLIVVAITILVPVLLVVAASILIDPNDFKSQIIRVVEDNTEGSLSIDGAMSWSFFPSIGVALNQLTYTLPDDNEHAFAALDEVKLSVKLLPLLGMAIETDGLLIKGLALHLRTDKTGVNNWQHLLPETPLTPRSNPIEEGSVGTGSLAINIAEISIVDASVYLNDERDGSDYVLEGFNIDSRGISSNGSPFPLDIQFKVQLSEPSLNARVKINTLLSANIDTARYQFEQLHSDVLLNGKIVADQELGISISSSGYYDVANNTAKLNELQIKVAQVFNVSVQLQVSGLNNKPQLLGSLQVDRFDANQLMQVLGLAPMIFNSDKALSNISVSGDFSGSDQHFTINPVAIRLDETQLAGRIAIESFSSGEVVVALQGDRITIDDYLSPAQVESEAPGDSTTATSDEDELLPIALLRDLQLKLALGLDHLIVSDVNLSQLHIKTHAAKGLVVIEDVSAKLYEGSVGMNGSIDVRSKEPSITLNTQIDGISIQPLLHDLAAIDTVSGNTRINATFKTRGNSARAFQNNLNGSLEFGIDDAILGDLNVDQLACNAIAQVRGKTANTDQWPAVTRFKNLGGVFQFKQGVGTNNDLAATLDNMELNGSGVVDLPANTVDYRMALRISGDLSEPVAKDAGVVEKSACAINRKYRDIAWPIRCQGSLAAAPSKLCGIDTKGLKGIAKKLLQAEAKASLSEKLFGPQKKGETSTKDNLKRLLFDNLF